MQRLPPKKRRPSTKRVIFTADDFGLGLALNEAVERAHREGALSTASLMVGAPAATDAIARAKRLPSLRVGLHVVVVHGSPLLPAADVSALVDADGRFSTAGFSTGWRYFASTRARSQLRAEIRAQFEAFAATGLPLDHVNAQSHFHVHPTVFGMLLEIGSEFGARAVRIPYEPFGPSWRSAHADRTGRLANDLLLAPWLGLMRTRARRAGYVSNDYVFGLNDTGRMTPERVRRLIAELPDGVSELYFHPATRPFPEGDADMPGYAFEEELAALLDPGVRDALRAAGAAPVTFGELAAERRG